MFERETFCEIIRNGKSVSVSCFEKRYDYAGQAYYARFDTFQSKQKKRVLDWSADKPENIRKSVRNFYEGSDMRG